MPASTYPASAYTQPSPQPYPPVQQGNYNVYPMQTAYPAAQGAAPGNQAVYSQQGNQGQNTAQYYSSGKNKVIKRQLTLILLVNCNYNFKNAF